ncbi:unnamed protein product [Musa textilis]
MNHLHEKSFDSWNESDELDVFEATRYFSGAIDGTGLQVGGFGSHRAVTMEDRVPSSVQKGNLDERLISSSSSLMKDKKCKQPSSPGARLVGLLNSFLHQAASGSKLKCLNPTSTTREPPEEGDAKEENSLGGGREEEASAVPKAPTALAPSPASFVAAAALRIQTCIHTITVLLHRSVTSATAAKNLSPSAHELRHGEAQASPSCCTAAEYKRKRITDSTELDPRREMRMTRRTKNGY